MRQPFEILLAAIRTGKYKAEVATILKDYSIFRNFNETQSMLLISQFNKKEEKKLTQDKFDIFKMIYPRLSETFHKDTSLTKKLAKKLNNYSKGH